MNGSGYVPSGNIFNCQFWQPDIGLSGLTARKTCLRGEKNMQMMILSFREQTLTNIIQGVRSHLTWEKDGKGTCTPPARRAETLPQEAHSQRNLPQGLGKQHCYRYSLGTGEATAAGAAAKHQRGKHRHCNCSAAQLPREGTRGQKAQGAQTVRVGNLRHTWP